MGGSSAEWVLGVGSWWMGDVRFLVISEGNKALTAERKAQRAYSGLLSLVGLVSL